MRKLNPQAEALADRYFFETLVRLHRAGENAPYTGLKPAGRDLGAAIPAADKALETGSDEALTQLLTDEVREGLNKHFKEVIEKKKYAPSDVAAGRELSRPMLPIFTTSSGSTKPRRNGQAGTTLRLIED